MKKFIFSVLLLLSVSICARAQSGISTANSVYSSYKQLLSNKVDSLADFIPDSVLYSEAGFGTDYQKFVNYWDPIMASFGGDMDKYLEMLAHYKEISSRSFSNTEPWLELGPNKLTENMIGIGPIEFIVFYENNPQYMLCGSTLGGLFFSNDGGETWTNGGTDNSDAISRSGIGSACFNPNNPNIWYASGSGQGSILSTKIGKSDGIYRTTDAGNTWELIADYNSFGAGIHTIINKIMIDPSNENILYVATNDGLYKTTNVNAAYPLFVNIYSSSISGQYYHIYDMDFKPFNSQAIYLGLVVKSDLDIHYQVGATSLECKVVYSSDAGLNWNNLPDNAGYFTSTNYDYIEIETSKANPDIVYVYAASKTNERAGRLGHLWKVNNGAWDFININTVGTLFANSYFMGWGHTLTVDPFNENRIVVGDEIDYEIYNYQPAVGTVRPYSVRLRKNAIHDDVEDIVFHPTNPNEIWFATHGGISKSVDGGNSSVDKSNGVGVSVVRGASSSKNVPDYMALGLDHDGAVYTATSYSETNWNPDWNFLNVVMDGLGIYVDPINPNNIFHSYQLGKWELIQDTHGPSSTITSIQSYSSSSQNWLTMGALNQINPNYFYYKNALGTSPRFDRVTRYTVTTGARSFICQNLITQISLPSASTNYEILGMWTNPNKENDLYISIICWSEWRIFLLKTSNANEAIASNVQWELFPIPITDYRWIKDLKFDPEDDNILYLLFDTKNGDFLDPYGEEILFKIAIDQVNPSLNNVLYSSWPSGSIVDLTDNLPRVNFGSLAVEKGSNGGIYISTDAGFFYTNNKKRSSGIGWQRFGTVLPKVKASLDLSINYKINRIRIGTFGRGAWEHSLQCPDDYDISLASPHIADDFKEAENDLYSSAEINASTKISYRAGNQIRLQPGFKTNGSNFHGFIHPCNHSGNSFRNHTLSNTNLEYADILKTPQDELSIAEYQLYPNPANELLFLKISSKLIQKGTFVEIIDITGKQIKSFEIQHEETILDVKDLISGMYFVKLNLPLSKKHLKFIKQ